MKTYSTLNEAVEAVCKVAKNEEGYLEKKSNAYLDSKTANAGYNNYTKYWRDLAKWGVMGQSSTFAGGPAWYWCAGFISWVFVMAFGMDNAKKLLMHMPYTSCANMGDIAKSNGKLYSDPKAGDIVLFWNGSRFSHTGLVYKVSGGIFYTAEGNTNSSNSVVANGGAVCLKSYNISTYKAKGAKFVRPDYKTVVVVPKVEPVKVTTTTTSTKTETTAKKYVVVKTKNEDGTLNCRKKPNKLAASKGKFKCGTKLVLKEETNKNWWKVRGKNLKGEAITGYCSTTYLKKV